jgi:hypothetical protein
VLLVLEKHKNNRKTYVEGQYHGIEEWGGKDTVITMKRS